MRRHLRSASAGSRGVATLLAAALAALLLPIRADAQTIALTSLPPYGSVGLASGAVTGVDFATHHVAVYIQIEGSGWWTKPTTAMPTVPIDSAGQFSADVATGGPASLDPHATIFCAALLSIAVSPPTLLGGVRIPASLAPLAIDCTERYARTFSFAGYTWAVKEAPLPAGPGSNTFSSDPAHVFTDASGLHLVAAFSNGQWRATEVILLSHLGHGTYSVQTDSRLDVLDVNLTFGMFTWDAYGDETGVPGSFNREIDFEDSRWTNAADPMNAQAVVQPYTVPGNLVRYTIPVLSGDARLTRFFEWTSSAIHFVALTGHQSPCCFPRSAAIAQVDYAHDPPANHYVPSAGRERLRLNLWYNNVALGGPGPPQPAGGQPVEVVISDVVYLPEPPGGPALAAGALCLALLARSRRPGSPTPSPFGVLRQ